MLRPDFSPDLLAAYRRARVQSSAVSPAVLFGARQPMTPAAAALDIARQRVARKAEAQAAYSAAADLARAARELAAPFRAKGYSRHTVTPAEAGQAIRAAEETAEAERKALAQATAARRPCYAPERQPNGRPWPAVTWQPNRAGLAAVTAEDCNGAGLRLVGYVEPESGRVSRDFRGMGWFLDNDGHCTRDGDGLAVGVVYQVTGRAAAARLVAGYAMPGGCGGPLLNLRRVYDVPTRFKWRDSFNRLYSDFSADLLDSDDSELRAAARAADSMAQRAAEDEREYRAAWAAGQRFADLAEEMAEERRGLLELLAERRKARAAGLDSDLPAICGTLRAAVASGLRAIEKARAERKALAAGEYVSDYLPGWHGRELLAAFLDGAGLSAMPAAYR